MRKLILVMFLAFSIHNTFAQEFESVRHTVQMGETVRMISRKYKVVPSEIYRLNKFAVDGISQGMVLQLLVPKKAIPADAEKTQVVLSETFDENQKTTPEKVQSETSLATSTENKTMQDPTEITHKVEPKETLYSLSKKYNVSVEEIKRQNEPVLKKGLQIGQVLIIRTNSLTGED